MKISHKLLVIVCLTVLEVSITVWATFQISKGARLHQLNSLHLKHNASFQGLVDQADEGEEFSSDALRAAVLAIREQPIVAAELVGPLDHLVMGLIGTDHALDLIDEDIDDADRALIAIEAFEQGAIGHAELIVELSWASYKFNLNSSLFEQPVTRTVSFMMQTMIPLIILISLFNICFISYLSRSISSSIKTLIGLLRSGTVSPNDRSALQSHVSGELGELMDVAKERLHSEFLNLETNQELRDLIADKTRSLRNATAQAEAALAAKERFLANMSHEIRTPINGILCAADLLALDLQQGDPHVELNSIVRDSASSLLCILNDILDVSKVESGKLTLEAVAFDVAAVIEQVASLMRPQAEAKGLFFEAHTQLSEGQAYAKGDPTRLRQIIVNLVSNALKFTDQGSVSVTAEMSARGPASVDLIVTVKDTGIGMTEAQQVSLFDRFVQADDSTTREYGGTGLGMSLSRELAQLMGGDISVQSQFGEGTEFKLRVPLQVCEAPPEVSQASLMDRDYGGAKVLLVEDNRVNQVVASKALKRLGIDVVLAGNGAAALELVTDEIALILMDIQMPVMDGLEATKRLRAQGCPTPIVALTANVFHEDRKRYIAAGMTAFLAKPIQLPELVARLDAHLQPARDVIAP